MRPAPPFTRQLKWTPLHFAAAKGQEDVVKLLLDHGANREAENEVRGVGGEDKIRFDTIRADKIR